MSGIEVVGLVLGAPPLLFYTLDNYKRILKPLVRYGKFEACLETLESELSVEQALFTNEVQILLSMVFSKDEACAMVTNQQHRLWQDNHAEELLKTQLGKSYDIVLAIIHDIAAIIEPLRDEVTMLSKLASEDAEGSASKRASKKRVAKHFRERIKFSLQEKHFETGLKASRSKVQTLMTLLQQSDRIEATQKLYKINRNKSVAKKRDLKQFFVVKESSKRLFEVVQRSCTRHDSHNTHFGLLPRVEDLQVAQVWFELLFGRATTDHVPAISDLSIRLMVESCLKSRVLDLSQAGTQTNSISASGGTQSQDLTLMSPVFSAEPKRKRVRFMEDGPVLEDFSLGKDVQLPDFMLRHDFCHWLSKNAGSFASQQDCCIGHFDCNSRHQLRFHVRNDKQLIISQPRAVSLETLLQKISNGELKTRFPFHEKFRFARILASAVLSFHDTPWLISENLNSSNILIYNYSIKDNLLDGPLPDPYISVPISTSSEAKHQSAGPHTFIKNLLVFRLGILLLEIAFDGPLSTLQIPDEQDRKKLPLLDSERATADRLMTLLRVQTCKQYEDVVKKCIRHYASDSPFEQCEDTQHGYYSDVISELQELEDKFRHLHTGDEDD